MKRTNCVGYVGNNVAASPLATGHRPPATFHPDETWGFISGEYWIYVAGNNVAADSCRFLDWFVVIRHHILYAVCGPILWHFLSPFFLLLFGRYQQSSPFKLWVPFLIHTFFLSSNSPLFAVAFLLSSAFSVLRSEFSVPSSMWRRLRFYASERMASNNEELRRKWWDMGLWRTEDLVYSIESFLIFLGRKKIRNEFRKAFN